MVEGPGNGTLDSANGASEGWGGEMVLYGRKYVVFICRNTLFNWRFR